MTLISAKYSGTNRIIQFFVIGENADNYVCLESSRFPPEAIQAVRSAIGKFRDEEIVELLRSNYPQAYRAAFKKLNKSKCVIFGQWELKAN